MQPFPKASDLERSPSAYQAEFLRFVKQHPQCLKRRTFEHLPIPQEVSRIVLLLNLDVPVQPWPVLLDAATYARFAAIAQQSFDLVRSLPERIFANDGQRLCEFYGLDPTWAETLERVIALPWRRDCEVMRGDFLLHDGQLKCIEINACAKTGGLYCHPSAEAVLREPLLQRFFAEQQVAVRFRDPWRNLLLTMIERAMARNLHCDGQLNLAFLIRWPDEYLSAAEVMEPAFKALLAEHAPGVEGKIIYCHSEHLERDGDHLMARGEPVQIVMQIKGAMLIDMLDPELEAWLDGIIDLYPGPLNWIYSDKRNLGLLSAHAERPGLFSREEAIWIDEHVPWSRVVRPCQTHWQGERRGLADLLIDEQQKLVLKPAQGLGGAGILVGCKSSTEEWRSTVESAMEYPGTYMVQEHLQDDLLPQQWGEEGCARCSINWGLFIAGDRFGGAYLRLSPPPPDGVVNLTNGAMDGCAFELTPACQTRPVGSLAVEPDLDLVRTYEDNR